ncbi:soluble quino protein glucose/sorbosone dehydrogenase [Podospora aff. communis PSN243]|uniref:Soluble quino protein glucose/sorbosone dehydrogenase n=1 Tax=Podospora aff. communis PSN243 TaxID=3040156 RepID=A0AAV9G5H0_9PEZI|nr:soluble quino protein glucose/sorbosone dehydrogenase [Podospora aff. communis PSN243]
MRLLEIVSAAAALLGAVNAEVKPLPLPKSCTGVANARYQLTAAAGWSVTKIAGGLKQVRTVIWDTEGNMLVLQNTKGASVHTFGADGCINSTTMLLSGGGLNHGLALTPDGKTLYASSETTVYSWDYNAVTRTISNQKTVVRDMSRGIHSSRTLMVVKKDPRFLLVQVGSNSNFDMPTASKTAGRAIIKIFDISKAPATGYSYNTQGEVFGYGLRNEIGFTEDPNGVVWGVENSGDDFTRTENGQRRDIHKDNPAEKLNNLGDPLKTRDAFYGYPTCFTVWDPSNFPNSNLKTGSHFVPAPNASFTDASCNALALPPRLTFQAHSAPIANTFDATASNMYVTFHGSWNRQPATGFKVIQIPFTKKADGSYDPVAPADSMKGYNDIWSVANAGSCTANGLTNSNCIRLTASAWDPAGRGLFVGSDNSAEGEVFILSPPK